MADGPEFSGSIEGCCAECVGVLDEFGDLEFDTQADVDLSSEEKVLRHRWVVGEVEVGTEAGVEPNETVKPCAVSDLRDGGGERNRGLRSGRRRSIQVKGGLSSPGAVAVFGSDEHAGACGELA